MWRSQAWCGMLQSSLSLPRHRVQAVYCNQSKQSWFWPEDLEQFWCLWRSEHEKWKNLSSSRKRRRDITWPNIGERKISVVFHYIESLGLYVIPTKNNNPMKATISSSVVSCQRRASELGFKVAAFADKYCCAYLLVSNIMWWTISGVKYDDKISNGEASFGKLR